MAFSSERFWSNFRCFFSMARYCDLWPSSATVKSSTSDCSFRFDLLSRSFSSVRDLIRCCCCSASRTIFFLSSSKLELLLDSSSRRFLQSNIYRNQEKTVKSNTLQPHYNMVVDGTNFGYNTVEAWLSLHILPMYKTLIITLSCYNTHFTVDLKISVITRFQCIPQMGLTCPYKWYHGLTCTYWRYHRLTCP